MMMWQTEPSKKQQEIFTSNSDIKLWESSNGIIEDQLEITVSRSINFII